MLVPMHNENLKVPLSTSLPMGLFNRLEELTSRLGTLTKAGHAREAIRQYVENHGRQTRQTSYRVVKRGKR